MIRLPYPISANRYWRQVGGGGRGPARMIVSQEALTYKREVATAARLAGYGPASPAGYGPAGSDQPAGAPAQQGWPAAAGQPVEVCIQLHPRTTKQTAAQIRRGEPEQASAVRLDLDNCIKVTLDALNGVAWVDDNQVVRISAEVGPALKDGGLTVWISRIAPGDTSSVCPISQETAGSA